MKEKDVKVLTEKELLQAKKKMKSEKVIRAVLIGFLVGISIFSFYNKGITFFSFFPLFFVVLLVKKDKKHDNIEQELKSRNLN